MKRWTKWGATADLMIALSSGLILPLPAHASLPELKLSPLKYQEHLELGHSKIGYVEASNPTSTTMHIKVEVQAFRQTDNRGSLEYFDDERLSAGIVPALKEFDLGPREAVRLKFTADPNKLGPGGAYGVIFLRVSSGNEAASQINTSARVGTLLIFDVGGTGTKTGRIGTVTAPRFAIGSKPVAVTYQFKNTGSGSKALAYAPAIEAKLGWSARSEKMTGPFVFPGRERQQTITLKPGNQLGPAIITLSDTDRGSSQSQRLIFLVSGFWIWLLPLGLIMIILALVGWRRHWPIMPRLRNAIGYRFMSGK